MKAGHINYQMMESTAKILLKNRKGEDMRLTPIEYLTKVVNEEYGLLRHCDSVVIKIDEA